MQMPAVQQTYAETHFDKIVLALLGAYGAFAAFAVATRWRLTEGFEPETIAKALVSGYGYGFGEGSHWLFLPGTADPYLPSAWTDPLFTLLYAGAMLLFGEASRLVIILFSLGCFLGAAFLTAMTARKLAGAWAGLIALVFLLLSVRGTSLAVNSAPLAALGAALVLFFFIRHAEHLTLRAAVLLGVLLGFCALSQASTIVFLPALILLIFWFAPTWGRALRIAALMFVTTLAVIAPWSLRNYLVFDEFVLTRNGAGQLVHLGTVALDATLAPGRAGAPLPVPWVSSGTFDVVARVAPEPGEFPIERLALEQWQLEIMAAQLGTDLDAWNEAQRDKWLLRQGLDHMLANPLLTMQLAVPKLVLFVRHSRLPPIIAAAATLFGILVCSVLAFRRKLLALPLTLVLAYAAPFAVIVPYFVRYRFPIEPVIAVLVGVAATCLLGSAMRKIGPRLGFPYANNSARAEGTPDRAATQHR